MPRRKVLQNVIFYIGIMVCILHAILKFEVYREMWVSGTQEELQ